jgi:hypothetical protein
MKRRVGQCPACGAEVEFKLSASLVTICEFCHSAVARGDRQLADHGKVADLVETNPPVQIGTTGRFEERRFEVVGRVQYDHPAGGVWDEFYLRLGGDKVMWLAAAQGRLYVTRERKPSEKAALPAIDSLQPGAGLEIAGVGRLVVAESGVAKARSAEGEIPWGFRPGAPHQFADLHGPNGEFATIGQAGPDSPPSFFLGRQVELEELGLSEGSGGSGAGGTAGRGERATRAVQVNCPQCAGPLSLFAPDESLRVACPNCNALLDCDRGNLQYLTTIPKPKQEPKLPLGSVATLRGVEYTVIGYLIRYVVVELKQYPWEEYLLYNAARGFRWLLCNQSHWALAETITAGLEPSGNRVTWKKRTFRLFDRGTAQVKTVLGEFYWRVTTDERVQMDDYIAPPQMLSFERSETDTTSELVVTCLEYVPVEEVEEAWHKELEVPWSVGPIQPAPQLSAYTGVICAVTLLVLLGLWFLFKSGAGAEGLSMFYTLLAAAGVVAWPVANLLRIAQFESARWADSPFGSAAGGFSDSTGDSDSDGFGDDGGSD